jgi:MYXO-CTERM domain-containing protein
MRCASQSVVCSSTLGSVILSLALGATSARAELVGNYIIGNGANASFVQFQFTNANTYLYEVRYDGSMTGRALFDIVAAAQPGFFSFTYDSFSFGDFVTGITIGTDTDFGYGTPPDYLDYWHYWTRASATDAWTESFIGFADRVVANGSWDGWVFNSASAPNAVPTPSALALLAGGLLATRRRR